MISQAIAPVSNKVHVRRRWKIRGIVQGVGFRPWICLVAKRLGLSGEVGNDTGGVWIEAEGDENALADFRVLLDQVPAPACILEISEEKIPALHPQVTEFRIAPSHMAESGGPALAPDLAPCAECIREMFDPADRRYLYPFIACARCGPRYSVTTALPYDRVRTSLVEFPLCPDCEAEYSDPSNRRFHAEAIACPRCGPRLKALTPMGFLVGEAHTAITAASDALEKGKIVAVQAVGGFQLWVDATSSKAVERLRIHKHRDAKPLAVMLRDIAEARLTANLTILEEQLLATPAAPIVLVSSRMDSPLAPEIAPGCSTVGICLPSSPLQLLLRKEFPRPVVATSGNISDEPICFDPADAIARLAKVADLILVHDRRIVHPADDSVVRIMAGRVRMIRRARGYAPAPIAMPLAVKAPGLAMGGQVKGALALVRGRDLMLSPHLGDQDTVLARERHADTTVAMQRLLRLDPAWVACDSHPDYAASHVARQMDLPRLEVQHHHAHLLAVLAEQPKLPAVPVLGVIWDGSGYGPDGSVWGGEFLLANGTACRRVGFFRPFALPGGERAVKEPRRSAFAWLWETLGPDAANKAARGLGVPAESLGKLCNGAAGTLRTSSAGRLFDAVAALTGLCMVSRYEGEAAIRLESAASEYHGCVESYPFSLRPHSQVCAVHAELRGKCNGWNLDLPFLSETPTWEIDTAPMAAAICQAMSDRVGIPEIAARFHQTLTTITATLAERIGLSTIVLGGGCFQNARLLECTSRVLSGLGHDVLIPEKFPANDGGLAAGQAFAGCWLHAPNPRL